MPTSSYMPDVKCEISFNGGFRVPMASWTWTDVSAYVELGNSISGAWGRGDERSTADANTVTLTLDNSDGRFTAERVTSPYYPNVKLYRPIRVKVDPVDGAEFVLFTGYVTSWPTEWEGTDAYAKATITASSRLARLGLNAAWRSIVEETYLADDPLAYYPLSEPEGATQANDASGLGAAPLTLTGDPALPVVFGSATGPGTDDLTAATFAGGQYLRGDLSAGADTLSFFFLRDGLPPVEESVVAIGPPTAGEDYVIFSLDTVGQLRFRTPVSGGILASGCCDGRTHHAAITGITTGSWIFYVDGVQVSTAPTAGLSNATRLSVGGEAFQVARVPLTGVLAHVAAYTTVLAGARIADHAANGLTAHTGELTSARLVRYAELAGIPAAEVTAEAGSTTMVHVDTTGQNVVELLRMCETTEGGVLFDGRDGNLTMHNRARRYRTSSALTLDMALQEVEADYSPRLDASALANDITASNAGGTVTAHVTDATSILDNGVATKSISTASDDNNEPLNQASWAKLRYATPRSRVPSLTVDALAQVGKTVNCAAVLAVTVGDKITVANHPSQAAFSLRDYFVEGGSFSIGPEKFEITWNVSPSSPDDQVLIIDDPLRGVIDTHVIGL